MSKRFTTLGRYPSTRLRRNRREEWSRRLVAEHKLSVDDLIWPVFVQEGSKARTPVESMPGVDRLSDEMDAVEEEDALGFATGCRPVLRHHRVLAARDPLHGRSIALWYLLNRP